MPRTSVSAEMDLTDTQAHSYSTPSATNNSTFSDISEIVNEHVDYSPFATLEHNICILDGSLGMFDDSKTYSYFSNVLSGNDCTTNNKIEINFSKTYSLPGMIFDFGDASFLGRVTLTYYCENITLKSDDFCPENQHYTEKFSCDNFDKIVVEFSQTKFPRMFTRLQTIVYGLKYIWEEDSILSCSLTEEIHPISSKAPINTCTLTVYDMANDFDLLNIEGAYKYLKTKQPFKIYALVGDTKTLTGIYFLDTWTSSKKHEMTFNLMSALGLLDRTTYENGGLVGYNELPRTAYDCLREILEDSGYANFQISETLKDTDIMGCIPICSHREALQNVALTALACIDDTRDGAIKIYRQNLDIGFTFSPNIMFDRVNVTQNEIVTGLDITLHYYDIPWNSNAYQDVFRGEIEAGTTQKIVSQEPIFSARYKEVNGNETYFQNGEYVQGKYIITFTAPNTAEYIVQVLPYAKSTSLYRKRRTDITDGEKEHILRIEKATLLFDSNAMWLPEQQAVTSGNIETFAAGVLNWYATNTLKAEFEYVYDLSIRTGERGSLFTEMGQYVLGSIISQNVNLGSGHMAKGIMLANHTKLSDYYFARGENYELCGNNDILI